MIERKRYEHDDERALIETTEAGEWVSVGTVEAQRALWKEAAQQALTGRRQRISILIPERDLARLKTRAAEQGLPYQTLINSILHQYLDKA